MESRYGDLRFSKKIRSINESKQTLKSHISISKCPRRVYKCSNWRSWCQYSYFNWGCLYFECWIEICSFKITKKIEFSPVFPIKEKFLWRAISWLRNVLEQFIKAQFEGLEVSFHNVSWKNCYYYLVLRKKALKIRKKSILLIRVLFPTFIAKNP